MLGVGGLGTLRRRSSEEAKPQEGGLGLTPIGLTAQVVVKKGTPSKGCCPGAAYIGLPDHGLAVVGGVGIRGAQLWRWRQALHVAGFPLQGPMGES
jgi:hypothetical protein